MEKIAIEVKMNVYSAKKSTCMIIKIRYGEGIKLVIYKTKQWTEIDVCVVFLAQERYYIQMVQKNLVH